MTYLVDNNGQYLTLAADGLSATGTATLSTNALCAYDSPAFVTFSLQNAARTHVPVNLSITVDGETISASMYSEDLSYTHFHFSTATTNALIASANTATPTVAVSVTSDTALTVYYLYLVLPIKYPPSIAYCSLTGPYAVKLGAGGAPTSVTLNWSLQQVSSASIDNGVGAIPPNTTYNPVSGYSVASISLDTTFTLTVHGTDGYYNIYHCTVITHAYRPPAVIAGDPLITVSGHALETRCDAPEFVRTAFNSGVAAGVYHTSGVAGSGVRMWPDEIGRGGNQANYAVQTVGGVSSVRPTIFRQPQTGLPIYYPGSPDPQHLYDFYNAALAGQGAGPLALRYESDWLWNRDPQPLPASAHPASDGDNSYFTNTYFGKPYTITYSPGSVILYQRYGSGSVGGYSSQLPLFFNDISQVSSTLPVTLNNNAYLSCLPWTTLTPLNPTAPNTPAPANQGIYSYYTQATDLMPIYTLKSLVTGVPLYATGSYPAWASPLYVGAGKSVGGAPNGLGTEGAYLIDCNKVLEAQLIVVQPDGSRIPNPYILWDGHLLCVSNLYSSTSPASPYFDDPVPASVTYINTANSYDLIFTESADRQLFQTRLGENAHGGIGRSAGYSLVPAPITSYDFGSPSLALHCRIGINLTFSEHGLYSAQHLLPGTQVEIRVLFSGTNPDGSDATGTHYTQYSGTAKADGTFDDGDSDYWMGFSGPQVPHLAGLQAAITLPSTTLPDGTVVHTETITMTVGVMGYSAHYQAQVTASRVIQPALVSGNWTINTPNKTIYGIQIGQDAAFGTGAAQVVQDVHRRTEVVYQSASDTGITFAATDDAGHTFTTYTVPITGNAYSPSLLVNPRSNKHRIIYSDGSALHYIDAATDGHDAADWGLPTTITLANSYTSPFVLMHPNQHWDYTLMSAVRSDGTTVDVLESGDGGKTFTAIGANAATTGNGLGRPVLAWMSGGLCFLVVSTGNALKCLKSTDGGHTWGNPVSITTSTGNSDITTPAATAIDGVLYAAASVKGAPKVMISNDLGATWAAPQALPSSITAFALGMSARSGKLILGTTHHSTDSGATWKAN